MSVLKHFNLVRIKRKNNLRLIVPDNFIEVGNKINDNINTIKKTEQNYIVRPNLVRFNNGEGKCTFEDSIRGKCNVCSCKKNDSYNAIYVSIETR